MTHAATQSRDQTARQRARQAMADELERSRKRESKLIAIFSAIDAREAAEAALGDALIELRDLGVAHTTLADLTGLALREVSAAIRTAKDRSNTTAPSEQTAPADDTGQANSGEHTAADADASGTGASSG